APAATLELRLLETSDLHMNLLAWDYYQDRVAPDYGLDRVATLIDAARRENPNNLLVDNGDLLEGSPLGDIAAARDEAPNPPVHPAIRLLAALHYDVANIGNHDFNYGLPLLRRAIAAAPFPYIDANVLDAKTHRNAFLPSVILTRRFKDSEGHERSLRIGLIGLVPPQIMQWDHANLAGRVEAEDMVETARKLVSELRAAGADLVVVVAHTGLERSAELPRLSENTATALARIPGIDALLLGHQHARFPGPGYAGYPGADTLHGTLFGVPAVMPARWGEALGLIDLQLDDSGGRWRVNAAHVSLRDTRGVAPDARIAALVAPEHAATLAAARTPVTETTGPLSTYFALAEESAAVDLVARAQLEAARKALAGRPEAALPLLAAAAPLKAGGSPDGYTDIPAGALTMRGVADLYVYPNTAQVVRVRGAELADWLEMSAIQLHRIDPKGPAEQEISGHGSLAYNFDCIEGVSYAIDLTEPPRFDAQGTLLDANARRIHDLRWQGRPVDPAAEFLVVTNNYRAGGGGHFPHLAADRIVLDLAEPVRDLLAAYLREHRPLTPQVEAGWRILPVPGVHLVFRSGARGAAYLGAQDAVRLLRPLDGGWALYELQATGAPPAPAPN
ncbi:MAG: bifunctional 2',3'-cyclic-nucleotide 2'-phosphodiesterase/3'-nucleotidase, partial [Paucibacter sp.]|nr:bifunctional 2',3'-cyclic-nucleotide 2'-phosphodiesterase/3'-nucleotidase [Roseateles sp.]